MRKYLLITLIALVLPQAVLAQIIGVSSTASESNAQAPLTYIKSIKEAGGVPLVIPITSDAKQLEAILEIIDGLVMTGGEDVNPLFFGEEPHPALGGIAPERDEFDLLLIKMAAEKKIPILAICRGHQAVNIAFGGTLYQDLPAQYDDYSVKHKQIAPRDCGTHTIDIEKGSILYEAIGKTSIATNTFHHQAVKDLAPGFKVTSRSKDGVIESIESENDLILGVQFHPEGFVSMGDESHLGIFDWLIKLSKK